MLAVMQLLPPIGVDMVMWCVSVWLCLRMCVYARSCSHQGDEGVAGDCVEGAVRSQPRSHCEAERVANTGSDDDAAA